MQSSTCANLLLAQSDLCWHQSAPEGPLRACPHRVALGALSSESLCGAAALHPAAQLDGFDVLGKVKMIMATNRCVHTADMQRTRSGHAADTQQGPRPSVHTPVVRACRPRPRRQPAAHVAAAAPRPGAARALFTPCLAGQADVLARLAD